MQNTNLAKHLWILDSTHTQNIIYKIFKDYMIIRALNFRVIIQKEQQSVVNRLYHSVNKIKYSLKWALDECCWSYFYKSYITLDITIFTAFNYLLFSTVSQSKEIMNVRSYFAEYYFLSDTKTTHCLKKTSEYYLKVFWLIYMHIILCVWKPLCVHVLRTLVTVRAICWALLILKRVQ